jgi:hypothetical protein
MFSQQEVLHIFNRATNIGCVMPKACDSGRCELLESAKSSGYCVDVLLYFPHKRLSIHYCFVILNKFAI